MTLYCEHCGQPGAERRTVPAWVGGRGWDSMTIVVCPEPRQAICRGDIERLQAEGRWLAVQLAAERRNLAAA